jgi:protein-disulfide isomerase
MKMEMALWRGVVAIAVCMAQWSFASNTRGEPTRESNTRLQEAQLELRATFSQLQFDELRESEIPGIVEIYTGPKIIYYAPAQKILIFGEMYSAGGISITNDKLQKFVERRLSNIDRASAITLGNGRVEVVAFVDPDCSFCRQAYAWFREKNFANVTQRVFFSSTATRPDAHARALRAVCASDEQRADMLSQAFDGRDAVLPTVTTDCEGGEERLAAQAKVANSVGVYATPTFMVKGQVIAGFNRERLESLISGKD